MPSLRHGGKDVGGRAWQPDLFANVLWQWREFQLVGAKSHHWDARIEEFLNYLKHHSALADARLSCYQNACSFTGFFQVLVNCLNLLAWKDSTVDGLVTQEAYVALVGLLNSREDMRVIFPVAAFKSSRL